MNQLLTTEASWRNAFFRQIETWDRVADSVNPLLFICLLGAALCLSRASHANAWRFLGRSALALLLVFASVKLLQKLDWFEAGRAQIEGNFPSTHMAIATSLAISLFFAARKWLSLLPLLVFYAWLMTALRYHLWIDILGGAFVAFFVTSVLHALMSRKQNAPRSSTRSSRNTSKNSSSKNTSKPQKMRPNARR